MNKRLWAVKTTRPKEPVPDTQSIPNQVEYKVGHKVECMLDPGVVSHKMICIYAILTGTPDG